MKAWIHQRSFVLALFPALVFLSASPVTARPTTQQSSGSRATPTPISSDGDTKIIETIQVFTMSGGNTTETCTLITTATTTADGDAAIVLSKNCSYIFTSSSNPSITPTASTTNSGKMFTTTMSSTTPAPTSTVLFSMFTTDGAPAPSISTTPIGPTAFLSPSIIATTSQAIPTPINDTGVSAAPSQSTFLPVPTPASATSSTDPFTPTAQSHLSSLPIFLGAFGGIAGLALVVVGIKVYHPVQRLNEMRLHPPAVMRRLKERSCAGWGTKTWRGPGGHDDEKLTGRMSQESDIGSGQTDRPPNGWIS